MIQEFRYCLETVTHADAEEYPVTVLEVLIFHLGIQHQVIAYQVIDAATNIKAHLNFGIIFHINVKTTDVDIHGLSLLS